MKSNNNVPRGTFFKEIALFFRKAVVEKLFFTLFLLFLISCKGPMRNPHTEDPVYQFFKKESENIIKETEKAKEELSKTEAAIEKALPQTGERRDLLESLFEQKNKLAKIEEKKNYIELKIKELIKEDQKKYKNAYENKKPWPDPSDAEAFKLQQEMETFKNKEWNTPKRIKKLLPKKETGSPDPAITPASH